MASAGLVPFPQQTLVSQRLDATADRRTVGMIEAPTATGKTLCICHHALATALRGDGPSVVAVPTVAIGHQTIAAMDVLRQAETRFAHLTVRMVVGRQEFLSPAGLEDLMALIDQSAADAVTAWMAQGAPGRTPSHARWTRDGLERHLDALDVPGVELGGGGALALGPSDEGSEAQRAYERQFASDTDVLVVTHAMLGRDLLSRFVATSRERRRVGTLIDLSLPPAERWLAANIERLEMETGHEGRLPDHRRLIVDEAHLLPEAVASAMSTGVSVCGLIRSLEALSRSEKRLVTARTISAVKAIRTRLVDLGRSRDGSATTIAWASDDPLQHIVRDLHAAVEQVSGRKVPADLEHDAATVTRARLALSESLRAKDAVSTVLEWSPVLGFPTITVGRRNLRSELDFMWRRLTSAALVSATLYTENVGGPSPDHMMHRLHVPKDRLTIFPTIGAQWLIDPVTAYVPTPTRAEQLAAEDANRRLDAVAAAIGAFAADSTDGMLVLTTSLAETRGLAERLRRLIAPDRVIDGTADRLSRLRDRHVAASRAGGRPVWIAQGPAWTGLDLPDDVLDTLAIARLPFPRHDPARNGGTAHYGSDKIAAMAMTSKQGIGRLVRSRDANAKRLVMLDGRIMGKNAAGVLNLLKTYRHRLY